MLVQLLVDIFREALEVNVETPEISNFNDSNHFIRTGKSLFICPKDRLGENEFVALWLLYYLLILKVNYNNICTGI